MSRPTAVVFACCIAVIVSLPATAQNRRVEIIVSGGPLEAGGSFAAR